MPHWVVSCHVVPSVLLFVTVLPCNGSRGMRERERACACYGMLWCASCWCWGAMHALSGMWAAQYDARHTMWCTAIRCSDAVGGCCGARAEWGDALGLLVGCRVEVSAL